MNISQTHDIKNVPENQEIIIEHNVSFTKEDNRIIKKGRKVYKAKILSNTG